MPEWLLPLLAAPFAGSLVGVLIRRLPAGRRVGLARSACEGCGRVLGWWEMVPLLSHVGLRGRCHGCGGRIAAFHWRVELAAVAVAGVVVGWDGAFGQAEVSAEVWADCALGWVLLALGWIDWEHGRLPDVLTLPLLLGGLAVTWLVEPERVLDHAIGAVAGWVAFRLVALGYRAWRGREGLGEGDAKLLAAAGAWVGWQGLDQVVLLGALASIGVAAWRGRGGGMSRMQVVPFGPGLAAAMLAVRLYG